MRGSIWRWLIVVALLLAPLSGCLQQDDGDGGDGGDSDGSDGSDGGDGGTDEGGGDVTRDEAYSTFRSAFANLGDESADTPERVGTIVTVRGANESSDVDFTVDMLVDGGEGFFVMSMRGEGFADDAEGGANPMEMFGGEVFITAQAWKTTFFGSEQMAFGTYNESAEPPRGFDDTSTGPSGPDGAAAFMGEFDDMDQADFESVRPVTYDGKPAVEIIVSRTDGNATFTGTIIVYRDPALPALVDAHVRNPDSENDWENDANLRVEFTYGADATHALEDGVKRLETLTLLSTEDQEQGGFPGFGGPTGPSKNFTIQPSHFEDHRVALEGVEAHAWASDEGDDTDGNDTITPTLVLRLEDGSAENDDLRLTFEDVDGDGMVSPGDELVVEYLTDQGQDYQVGLFDEETGLRVIPAVPALLALVLLALAPFGSRRRRA